MKKNFYLLFVVALIAGLMLSACGGGAAPSEEDAAPQSAEAAAEVPSGEESSTPAQIGIDPMEGAVQLTDSTTEASAKEMAGLMQISESISWEGWELPVDTDWDTVLGYYDEKAAAAGWSSDAGTIKDIGDNKVAVFGKADGSRLAIIYLPQSDKVQVLAVAGK